jgi:hypothetical protein
MMSLMTVLSVKSMMTVLHVYLFGCDVHVDCNVHDVSESSWCVVFSPYHKSLVKNSLGGP